MDTIAPTVAFQLPFANVTVRSLTQIEVNFSEPVTGLEATDLLINGSPANHVNAVTPQQYVFAITQPPVGPVQVAFAAGHGISDFATVPNNFAGANWTYTLDPNAILNSLRLNELMAANINGLRDENNTAQDWVELFNTSSNTVSLAGWSLSNDENNPAQWVFPPVSIGPRSYLVVFCSAKDRKPVTPGGRLHTNFKLSPDGEFLGLYNAEVPQQLVSSFNPYPNQRTDYSWGLDPTEQLRYFQTPTPGTNNGNSTITGVVADTKFSHKRGFYTNAFSLSITCATPGVTIRYTTNGTAPTVSSGTVYVAPINIGRTTPLRAAAFKTGLLPSDVDAQTYLFLADVILQPNEVAPTPAWPVQKKANGGGQNYDYGMDPDIVNNALYAPTIKGDLMAVPTFSIVMDQADWNGIYSNPGGDGIANERGASLELIFPDDTEGFQANCGIRLRGGFSRSQDNPKHAFRFFFRQEYGLSKLNYPVFGAGGAQEFDKFDLRTMQNYSWSFGGDPSMMCLRDLSSRDAQLAMGQITSRGYFYHLYINGVYWGLYNSDERPEAAFAASYLGGNAEDYDTIKQLDGYLSGATDGNNEAWYRLWQAATNGFASDADYFKVQGLNVDGTVNPAYENLLDVSSMIDYMLVILYGGNLDAPISNFLGNDSPNNWYGVRDRTGQHGGFRFISHDAEHTLLNVGADRTGITDLSATGGAYGVIDPDWTCGNPLTQSGGAAAAIQRSTPQYIWFRMHQNPEFRILVADHVQKHFFNGGPLSVEGMRALLTTRSNELQRAIVAESARWGDAKVEPAFTRATWLSAFNSVMASFVPGRTATVLSQLRADGLFPNLNAPLFSSRGGAVSNGFSLYLTNSNGSGVIYYTLDGTDPRLRGGAISPNALAYTPGTPVVMNLTTIVRARVRNGTVWSAITEATFYPGQDFSKLLVTEIMYHPPSFGATAGDELEFLELKNTGASVLDLTGTRFTEGIDFAFTNVTRIQPGQFFLLGRNRTALASKYPGLVVHGLYTKNLGNGGEVITLQNALGTTLLSVEYKDGGRWPVTPDGHGHSLVPLAPDANPNPDNPSNWRASTNPGGSPGADDPASTIPRIVVNEALTHTILPVVDAIELHNPTDAVADLGGWFLTDDAAFPTKFRITNGTMLPAGGYLVLGEADFNPTPGLGSSFSLDARGEEIYLLSGSPAGTNLTGYSHGFSFGNAPEGVSFGRHPISTGDEHFVLQTRVTLGAANAGPRVGPVVFRQIMYHPIDLSGGADNVAEEFLELRNITDSPVALYDPAIPTNTWRLRGGASFDFPANVVLGSGQSLVLVSFDPANAALLAAFRSQYGTLSGVPTYGPYSGKLDNSSDTVELRRPLAPDTNGVAYVAVDTVGYKDSAPWPSAPDGSGSVLQRLNLSAYGDDPANWVGAAPLSILNFTPTSAAVRPGTNAATATNVTFRVNAIGTGTLQYQWRKNDVNISGATADALTLLNVQSSDAGNYSVLITDNSGFVLSPVAPLYIISPTIILQGPVAQTVVAGGRYTLSISISGSPPPFGYAWTSNSVLQVSNVSAATTMFQTFTAPTNPISFNMRVIVRNLASPSGVSPSSVAITVLADTDRDGLPDAWENAHGLSATNALDASLDTDGDSLSNGQEYIAGTNPNDPSSYLKVEGFVAGNPATLQFQSVSNRTYTVQFKDGLDAPLWNKLADVVARSTNRLQVITDPAPGTNRIYRLVTPLVP